MSAESANVAASSTRIEDAPKTAISPPASGPPADAAMRTLAVYAAVARLGSTSPASVTARSRTRLAATAGVRSAPLTATSTRICQYAMPTLACRTGMASTATALTASDSTAVRLAPSRSTTAPATSEEPMTGTVSQTAAIPVRTVLPVVASTNHGSATRLMAPPATR
jgi:hypothetical protein